MAEASSVADKRSVRSRMRSIRAEIASDPADRARRSAAICDALIAILRERRGATRRSATFRVLLYEPLAGEPDLAALKTWCAAQDISTYVPRVDAESLAVEPGDLAPTLLDVAIVPGLAFAPDGRRLGQGGGHFDRFLPRLRGGCLRIGVAFTEQLLVDVPTENHDARVHVVVTDRSQSWTEEDPGAT